MLKSKKLVNIKNTYEGIKGGGREPPLAAVTTPGLPLPGIVGAGRPGGAGGGRVGLELIDEKFDVGLLPINVFLGPPPGEGGVGEGPEALSQSSLTGGGAGE